MPAVNALATHFPDGRPLPHQTGCYKMTAILAAPADQADKPIHLRQSWLPIYEKIFDHPIAQFRCPNVIPCATQTASFKRLLPALDMYAKEKGWVVQPVFFHYRPAILDMLQDGREEMSLTRLRLAEHSMPIEDRVAISLYEPGNVESLCKELIDFCAPILAKMGVEPEYLTTTRQYGNIITNLIIQYPFLVHHIFSHFPNLAVIHHDCVIRGRNYKISHIRVSPDDYIQAKTSALGDLRNNITNVLIP